MQSMRGSGKASEVLVRWVNFSEEHDSWEPMDYIEQVASKAVAAYRDAQRRKERNDEEAPAKEKKKNKVVATDPKPAQKRKGDSEAPPDAEKRVCKKVKAAHAEMPRETTALQVGDLIWGKTRGYKWWPGQVEQLLDGKVLVAYLGDAGNDDELKLTAVRLWDHPKAQEMLKAGRNEALGPKVPGALPADFRMACAGVVKLGGRLAV